MILDFFDKNALSAEEWEELCDACYAIRYKEIWHKVPSDYLGDAGIEGYVETGIVYQCYRQFLSAKDNVCSPFAFFTRIALLVAFAVLQVGFNIFILTVKIDESIKGAKAFIAFAATF